MHKNFSSCLQNARLAISFRQIIIPLSFFTNKLSVHGTKLRLRLAYDIVKAQRGELKIKSAEGEGSDFTIQLPFTKTL